VLWTSGWDSTFRVADLALNHGVVVQPHYMKDWRRASTPIELKHQNLIWKQIARLDKEAADRILPPIVHDYDAIPPDPLAHARLARIGRRIYVGSQYVWLSNMARAAGLDHLELGIHSDDQASQAIGDNVAFYPNEVGGYHALVDRPGDTDFELFGPFRCPVIDLTKIEMGEHARQSNFDSVMELTWFCAVPVAGKPCGFCGPCRYTRDEGLGRRVPHTTRLRWARYMAVRKGGALRRQIEHKLGVVPDSSRQAL